MKNLKLIIFAIFAGTVIQFGFWGIGDIVSDPGSYGYYVEQLKMMTEQFETMKKQVEQGVKSLEQAEKLHGQFTGIYNHATGTVDELKKISEKIKKNPSAMKKYASKFLEKEVGEESEYIDARELISGVFKDPRAIKDQIEVLKQANQQYHLKQKTLEQAVLQAENTLNEMPRKHEKIKILMQRIDKTENVKSAIDLNNRLLAEILRSIDSLENLTAYIGQAQAIVKRRKGRFRASQEGIQRI